MTNGLKLSKQIGEVNFSLFLHFCLSWVSFTDCLVHTHHQNGVVERKHRHIVELGLSLLSHASLPLSFWDHAFLTGVYLINRLPSAPLKFDTPYHVLFQTDPHYQFLKVFGCSCCHFLHAYHSHKLEFRSTECVFLGYSPSHKGYKCMSSSGRIFIQKMSFLRNSFSLS